MLSGRVINVVRLDPAAHATALYEGTHGSPEKEELWRYMFDGPFADLSSFRTSLEKKAASKDPLFFAIVDRESDRALGYAALMRDEPAHRVIEIGSIVYSVDLQRTAAATEAMYLFAKHVFETLRSTL